MSPPHGAARRLLGSAPVPSARLEIIKEERGFEHPRPSAGAEVIPSGGLEKPLASVQMDFPSSINQFEGSEGS